MANIKELKKKIKTTKGTLKITSAMKLVSASKLARAQQAVQQARPYAMELEETVKTVSALCEGYDHDYLNDSENTRVRLLVISANKGLCGGYNSLLAKEVRTFLGQSDFEVDVSFVGKKVKDVMSGQWQKGHLHSFERNEPTFSEIREVASGLSEAFVSEKVGKVFVAYNKFHSAMSFSPTISRLLPIALEEDKKDTLRQEYPFDFKYEPGSKEILDALIPEMFVCSLWLCMLDGLAAEHGSRMTAMDSAVTNCKEAIREQTIKMNKLRQAAITTELIEVVSGAESLNG